MGKRCCGALDRLAIDVPLLKEPKTGTLSEQPGVFEHPRRLLGQVNSDADLDPTKPQPDQQEDDGERHQDLLRLAGRGPSLTGKPTVKPSLSSINTDSPLNEGKSASIQGLRDPLPGPVVDELARRIDPAPGWTQRPNGIWLLTIHGWTLAAVPGHADWDSQFFWSASPPWPLKHQYGSSGYVADLEGAKRQALLYLRNQFDLGGTDTSLKDLFDRLLGGGLLTEDNDLGEFVDPAIKPRDLAHPNDRWRPIGTAPMDRTSIIVAVPSQARGEPIVSGAYFNPEAHGGTWWWNGSSEEDGYSSPIEEVNDGPPICWQPWPGAPKPGDIDRG